MQGRLITVRGVVGSGKNVTLRRLQQILKEVFIDEAHDLNGYTLIGLKLLMEVVEDVGGRLSVILAGHLKLRNDLRRPTMEEIAYRTDISNLDGIAGSQRDYIQLHLTLALEAGYQTGEKPATAESVETVLSR